MTDQLHCPMSYAVYKFQPEIGEFSACCDAVVYKFNKDWFEELGPDYFEKFPALINRKKSLYENIKHHDCNQCWNKEELGIRSMRQIFGERYTSLYGNRNLHTDRAYVSRVELWMNSTCNLGCFMCNMSNSNTIRKIWNEVPDLYGNVGKSYDTWINKQDYQTLYRKKFTAYMIEFTLTALRSAKNGMNIAYLGGEPTLHDEMYEHTEMFIDAARDNIANGAEFIIEIVTNGTSKPRLNTRFMEMFKKYKNAGWKTKIMLSQDASDEYAQVRHGADFDAIRNNFSTWIATGSLIDEIKSHTVISNLNLPYIDKMADYIVDVVTNNYSGDKTLEINFNTLTSPKWMHLKYLPKKYAIDSLEHANNVLTRLKQQYNIKIDISVFDEILNALPNYISNDDANMIFEKYKYTNARYEKMYNGWNMFDTFHHLNPFAKEYGIDI
jgi:organic radical activating enzyme